jgi:hypothetical protein
MHFEAAAFCASVRGCPPARGAYVLRTHLVGNAYFNHWHELAINRRTERVCPAQAIRQSRGRRNPKPAEQRYVRQHGEKTTCELRF